MRRWFIAIAIRWLKELQDQDLKHEVLTEAVKHLFNTIDADDVLKVQGNTWLFRGRPLSEPEVLHLKEEAEFFQNSKLWRILSLDVKYQLNKKMYEQSNVTMDVMWGKLLLYYHDILRTRIDRILK